MASAGLQHGGIWPPRRPGLSAYVKPFSFISDHDVLGTVQQMLVNLISTASSVVEMIYPHSPGNESFCNATCEPAEAGRGQARSSQPRSRSPCEARLHPRCRHHRLGRRGGCQTASLGGPSSATPLLPSLSIDSALEPHPLPVHVPRGPRLLDEPQTGCSSPPPRLLEIYVIKQFRHHPPRNSLHYRCHLHGRTSTQRRTGRPAPRGSRPLLRLCWGQRTRREGEGGAVGGGTVEACGFG